MKAALIGLSFCLLLWAPGFSQTPNTAPPSFEVATVKPNLTGEDSAALLRQPGGRFVATNMSLKGLISYAYRVRSDQISGGPSWINTDRWNVEAKAGEGSIPIPTGRVNLDVPDTYAIMLQSLLEDRFQVKMHRETKDLPAYDLVVTNGGPKMKPAEDQTPLPYLGATLPPQQTDGPTPRGSMMGHGNSVEASAVPLSDFIRMLSQLWMVGRPVIDKTGLKGLYDFKLEWTPPSEQGAAGLGAAPTGDTAGPSIFTALQEQLGLKLESTKAPAEVIVVDSAQKPSED